MSKIAFLFTCHNRIEKSRSCIESVRKAIAFAGENGADISEEWFVCDAGSSDNTAEMLKSHGSKIHIREVDGATYYSQGMRICMEMVQNTVFEFDYIVLVNDDVLFYEEGLGKALTELRNDIVTVGATDYEGSQSYGGIRYIKAVSGKRSILPRSVKYRRVDIKDSSKACDTFNANCVIIPSKIFYSCPMIDKRFIHGLGDFDYGMMISEAGFVIETTDYFVGSCANNSKENTYQDVKLSRRDRIRRLRDVKGAPTGPWFYYLKKHFGITTAIVYSISPYVRILLGR